MVWGRVSLAEKAGGKMKAFEKRLTHILFAQSLSSPRDTGASGHDGPGRKAHVWNQAARQVPLNDQLRILIFL